jgi:carbamoyl-phosphate synthase large subunit
VLNILFTSAGRRVELIRAFRRAYQDLDLRGEIVTTDIDPLAAAPRLADHSVLVPRVTDPGYVAAVADICRTHRIHTVFPLIDPDIDVLAPAAATFRAMGTHIATVAAEHVDTISDKWKTTDLFKSLGLPTPQSWLPGDPDIESAGYPLFIKPRRGSASAHTYVVRTPDELTFFERYVPDAIVQEWLPGAEITTDVICDGGGAVLGVISRRRIEVRWGEVSKGVTCSIPEVASACQRIARALDARGPITVQGIVKDRVVHFTEINARLGGGSPLAIAAGADFPRWLLARAAGIAIEVPAIGTYRTDVFLTRFDESLFLSGASDGLLQSHHS